MGADKGRMLCLAPCANLSAHLNRRHGLGHVRTFHVVAMGNRLGWFLPS